jgi:mxaJ protein
MFDVSMGVRKDDRALKSAVEEVLARKSSAVEAILADYGVPVVTD